MGILDSLPPVSERLTRSEVADLLGVRPNTVTTYATKGYQDSGIFLKSYHPVGVPFYTRADVDDFLRKIAAYRDARKRMAKSLPGIRETRKRQRMLRERAARHRI